MQIKQSIKLLTHPHFPAALLLLFVPILYSKAFVEMYEFPKMYFIYLVSFISFGFFCTRIVLQGGRLKLPSPEVLIYLFSFILSVLFSSHIYTSVWGYYSRFNGGFLSVAAFFLMYLMLINAKKPLDDAICLFDIATISVVPVSAYGIAQHFADVDRVYSTFGQPNWLAQYLAMLLPFALYRFFKDRSYFHLAAFIVGFPCLWFTYSMSGLLAFFVSFAVIFCLLHRLKESIKWYVGILFFMAVVMLARPGIFYGRLHDALIDAQKFISQAFVVYAESEHAVSDPGLIRSELWKGTFRLFVSSPKVFILGTGPQTFPYAFQKFRPLGLNYSSEWDFVFNRPHNYYLEILSERGIIGFFAFVFMIRKLIKKLPFFLLPSVIAFLIANVFGWPVSSTDLLFWVMIFIADRAYEV